MRDWQLLRAFPAIIVVSFLTLLLLQSLPPASASALAPSESAAIPAATQATPFAPMLAGQASPDEAPLPLSSQQAALVSPAFGGWYTGSPPSAVCGLDLAKGAMTFDITFPVLLAGESVYDMRAGITYEVWTYTPQTGWYIVYNTPPVVSQVSYV